MNFDIADFPHVRVICPILIYFIKVRLCGYWASRTMIHAKKTPMAKATDIEGQLTTSQLTVRDGRSEEEISKKVVTPMNRLPPER